MATNPQATIAQQQQRMAQQRQERLGVEIASIAADLAQVTADANQRMPERVFANIWVPFFAGEELDPRLKVDLRHWVSFSGGAYRSVDVVNTQGEVIFTVPPLFDRSAVNPVSKERGSLAHVMHSAQQYSNIHPAQGQMYLDKELSKRALVMKVPASVLQNLELWNKIFKRYGRPPLMEIPSSAPNQPNQPAAGATDVEFEFDPL